MFNDCLQGQGKALPALRSDHRAWRLARLFVQIAVVAHCAAALSCAAQAQEAVKAKFGAWALRCDNSVNSATGECALTQTIRSDDKANVTIAVMIRKTPQIKNGLFQVVAPLNVILPQGVKFKIDQLDIGQLPFFKCSPIGCIAEGLIDDALLERLKAGRIGVITIYLTPEEGLRHLVALEGLKEGLEALH
jgi:invasion protein IalB